MDNSNDDIPVIDDDMPLMGGSPTETTETVSETPVAPVQPTAPSTSETDTPAEDGTTPPKTDEPAPVEPASDTNKGESTDTKDNTAYQAWIERQRTKTETTQKINENYTAPTEQDLIDQGLSEQDARIEAKLQEINFAQERARVSELNASMRDEAVQVQQQFDVFNPSSPNFDKEFAEQVSEQYKQYARVQTDDNGIVLNADVPLFDFYKQAAGMFNRGLSRGNNQAQSNSEQMLARTENPGGSASDSKRVNEMSQDEFLAQYGDQPLF